MKRFLSILIVICVILFNISVSADEIEEKKYSNQNIMEFDESQFVGLDDLDRAKAKMRIIGIDEEYIEDLPVEKILVYKDALWYTSSNKYFKEAAKDNDTVDSKTYLNNDNNAGMLEIDEKTFNESVRAYQQQLDKTESRIEIDLNDNNLQAATSYNYNFDYGVLNLTIDYAYLGNAKYSVASRYEWTVPPRNRGKDVYGVLKDTNLAYIPSTFYRVTKCEKETRTYYVASGYLYSYINSTVTQQNEAYNYEYSGMGFVNTVQFYDDYTPGSIVPGQYLTGWSYKNMRGYTSYQGLMQFPQSITNFNIAGTYSHQKGYYFDLSSFGISFNGSGFSLAVSVKPTQHYQNATVFGLINYRP